MMRTRLHLMPCYLFVILALLGWVSSQPLQVPRFTDVTATSGIDLSQGKTKKYGGPTIVDLDRDGHYDMLFCHHDNYWVELYWNNGDGTFTKAPFYFWDDVHGIIPAPISSSTKNMHFSISIGGNYGRDPKPPLLYEVDWASRTITEVTHIAGVQDAGGRGRTSVFFDMSARAHTYWPDVLFINAGGNDTSVDHQFAFEGIGDGLFKQRPIPGYRKNPNWYATTTDIDGDHTMEVISFHNFTLSKLIAPFSLRDITRDALDNVKLPLIGVVAVAEFDYDNDGDFDLYLARTKSGDLGWLPDGNFDDILLENRNGVFVDVSEQANIMQSADSRGVTTADFNNDGYVDIYVTRHVEQDVLFLNKGDGTFQPIYNVVARASDTRGDMAAAVDYDSDGLVDLVMGEGDSHHEEQGGTYRILKNTFHEISKDNYLAVRVGNAPDRSATPLHAVVTVMAGSLKMTRRVGTPGVQVSTSYMELIHFGLGPYQNAEEVVVTWSNGIRVSAQNLKAGSTTLIGTL